MSSGTTTVRASHRTTGVGGCLATGTSLPTFVSAAANYWLSVFPNARQEIRHWRERAHLIPDPSLRKLAIETHACKHRNLEGAAAFATFVRPSRRRMAVRGLVAYQTLFDYLDTLAEQPSSDPIAGGRRLNTALLVATAPSAPHIDYYAHLRRAGHAEDDGGYLHALIATSRVVIESMPSFAAVAELARGASERVGAYQSLNHGDGNGRHDAFDHWARQIAIDQPHLRWWETGAAAGSTLDLLALIAAASDPSLERESARELAGAYFPWVGALHSLLDSLVDREEDHAGGRRGLIDYYASPNETAERIATNAAEAVRRTARLPDGQRHMLVVAAMIGFYVCDLVHNPSPYARLAAPAALDAMGPLAGPTMYIFRARLAAGRASARMPRWRTAMRTSSRRPNAVPHSIRRWPWSRPRSWNPLYSDLENQVFDFPLDAAGNTHNHGCA